MDKKIIILLFILPFIFTGCWDQKPIERIGISTLEGIESSPEGELKVTYTMPLIDPDKKTREETIDATAQILRYARNKSRRQSSKDIEIGKGQVILYSKEIAQKGLIQDINEIFERDISLPSLAWIVIVDGSPRDLIHKSEKFKDKPILTTYINGLLERGVTGASTVETRLFRYDIDYYSPGIDNIAPLVMLNDNAVELKGSALFSKGKMVGTINPQQNGLLMSMMKTLKNKQFTYITSCPRDNTDSPKYGISILLRQNSKKIKVCIKNNKPIVDIYLDLNGYIDEYKWNELKNEKKVKILNDYIQKNIQDDCERLLEYLQAINSDPIGIGEMVRAKHNSYWKSINWKVAYKNAKFNVHVKFNIVQYGALG